MRCRMTVKALHKPTKGDRKRMQAARKRLKDVQLKANSVRVRERDCDRCRVCTATRGIEVHHVVYRSRRGTHDTSNLVCLCGECHRRVHAARLGLSGDADGVLVVTVKEPGWPVLEFAA